MHNPEQQTASEHLALAERWRRVRSAYRLANLASHHLLGFTVKLALLVYFAFMVLFLMLRYAILPNVDYYKGDIERLASRALGNQVSIARIYASWRGLRPNLFLGDVILRDAQGRQLLALPSVSATVSWWSVAAGEARFEALEIIRPELDVRRMTDGKLSVAGIVLDNTQPGDGKGADWIFKQREIVIREGRLHWTDQQRGAPELTLENVNMALLNRWNAHRMALQATPPAALGQPLDLRADFTHPRFAARISDLALWKGELYAELRGTDLAAWKDYLDYPFQLTRGKGSLRAWISLDQARLAGFTADVGLADVSAKFGGELPQLDLAKVSGRIAAHEEFAPAPAAGGQPAFGAYGHSMTLTDFSIETTDGLKLAPTTMSETFIPAKGGKPESVEIRAKQVDLATLAELAEQLPISAAQRTLLADFAPRGRLLDFSAQWSGKYPALAAYRVKGQLAGLGLHAQPGRSAVPKSASAPAQDALPATPGFENLSGTIDASDKGGSLTLHSEKLVLQLPAWFADPVMPFDLVNMQARWSYPQPEQLLLQLDSLDFVQGKLKGNLAGKHLLPLGAARGKHLGYADFEGRLSGFEINTIDRYLPQQTPPDLRAWLDGALEDGVAQDVSIKLRGELSQFPFRAENAAERARGEFRVAGRLENAKLNYAPSHLAKDGKAPLWPQAEKINGSIVFDRARMEIKGDSALTLGVGLSNVKAVIPDLTAHDLMLDIDGSAAGPMQEFLRYVAASPVLEWIGHFTEDTRAGGAAKLALKLHLPLSHLTDAKVQGALQLTGNDVLLFPDLPPLQATSGKIEFNEHGVNLNAINASFLGGPLALTGGSQRDNSIVIRMAGTIAAEGMRRSWPAPAMQRLADRFSGSTRFTGAVTVKDKLAQVTVDSTLAGLGLDFPAPVQKAAADTLPLHFTLTGMAVADGAAAHDEIRLTLGSTIAARYSRQKQGRGPWTVLRGGVGVNVPAPEPDSGMMVNVNLKSLNVDQWLALSGALAAPHGEAAAAAEGDAPDLSQYVAPTVMAARAGELIVGDRKLDNVVVGASHQTGSWQASIDSHQVSGYVTWNES
ncbi:MAG TPA: DUF3971 domain-containing protein, partial [Telluria sp.]|nr:DUF3971 domain-containing protein [Telluria sp.]